MKNSALAFSALLLSTAVTPCAGQSAVPADLRTAMQSRYVAIQHVDVPAWDRLTGSDFTLVGGTGRVFTKAQRIAQMKTQQPDTTSSAQIPEETVRMYGNSALERYNGGGAWVQIVWSKGRDGWRAVSAQVTPIEADSAAVRTAIDGNNARVMEGFKRGDVASFMDVYAEDVVFMVPNTPAWEGAAAVRQGLTGLFAQFSVPAVRLVTHDVVVNGFRAIERGTYELTLHPKSGAGLDIPDNGKYLTVWEQQDDGSWKVIRDIHNSDRPGPM